MNRETDQHNLSTMHFIQGPHRKRKSVVRSGLQMR